MNTLFRLIDVDSLDAPFMRSSVYWLWQYIKRNDELQNHYRSNCGTLGCQEIVYRNSTPIAPCLPEDDPDEIIKRLLGGWEPGVDPRIFLDNNTVMTFTGSVNEGSVNFSAVFDINAPRDRLISEFTAFIDYQKGERKLKSTAEAQSPFKNAFKCIPEYILKRIFKRNLYATMAKDKGGDMVVLVQESLSGLIDFSDRPKNGDNMRAIGLWLYEYRRRNPCVSIERATDAFALKWPDLYHLRNWNGKLYHRITEKCIAQAKVLPFKESS